MIDLHCHILPGVDDGADGLDTALAMIESAWQSGTDCICATPHCCRPTGWGGYWADEILEHLRTLRRAAARNGLKLELLPGMEVFATPELPKLLREGKLLTLNKSRYLLLEFFFDDEPEGMQEAIDLVWDQGLTPVIAHPERYEAVQREPGLALSWFRSGCILQLNKGSILGGLGRHARQTAWWLLRRGLAHVVASDAHSDTQRTPRLDGVYEELCGLDPAYAELLLMENPRRILMDEQIVPVEEHP